MFFYVAMFGVSSKKGTKNGSKHGSPRRMSKLKKMKFCRLDLIGREL